MLAQVCHSLGEAHALGIVHRDITPANLFLCRRGAELDFVKVLDFGLADVCGRDGRARGTPAYMAPELARGGPVDGRADLYALACVGHWLLTGRPPFAAAAAAVLADHMLTAPPSLAGAGAPAALDRLLSQMMAKRADDRPPTAADVAAGLATIEISGWNRDRAEAWWARFAAAAKPAELAGTATLSCDALSGASL
jgi:serine/threonine-protein kinase